MATKLRIQTLEDTNIHFDFKEGGQNYTLCGLEVTGDDTLGISASEIVIRKKVNCPRCIQIVSVCKKIKRNEYR